MSVDLLDTNTIIRSKHDASAVSLNTANLSAYTWQDIITSLIFHWREQQKITFESNNAIIRKNKKPEISVIRRAEQRDMIEWSACSENL